MSNLERHRKPSRVHLVDCNTEVVSIASTETGRSSGAAERWALMESLSATSPTASSKDEANRTLRADGIPFVFCSRQGSRHRARMTTARTTSRLRWARTLTSKRSRTRDRQWRTSSTRFARIPLRMPRRRPCKACEPLPRVGCSALRAGRRASTRRCSRGRRECRRHVPSRPISNSLRCTSRTLRRRRDTRS